MSRRLASVVLACLLVLAVAAPGAGARTTGPVLTGAGPATVVPSGRLVLRTAAPAALPGLRVRLQAGSKTAVLRPRRIDRRTFAVTVPARFATVPTPTRLAVCLVQRGRRSCLRDPRRPGLGNRREPAAHDAARDVRTAKGGKVKPTEPAPAPAPEPAPAPAPAPEPAPAPAPAPTEPVVISPAPPTLASPVKPLGLFEDLQYLTGTALQTRLDEHKAAGGSWARFQMIWSNVQHYGTSSWSWWPYDALIAGLKARGIQPLVVLGTTPAWARPANCQTQETCAPANPAQFAAFARAAVARYKGQGVKHWEVWNEPNTDVFWKPGPDPAAYGRLLSATYGAIKAEDPQATVLSGGTAPAADTPRVGGGFHRISPVRFVSEMYAAGGDDHFDALAHHPYTYPALPGGTGTHDAWHQMAGATPSLRSVMTAHGDAAKKIWATEFGSHTLAGAEGYVTPQRQADILRRGIDLWSTYDWAGPMIVHRLHDTGTSTTDREDHFGLKRLDGTSKPAYDTFVSAAQQARSSSPAP